MDKEQREFMAERYCFLGDDSIRFTYDLRLMPEVDAQHESPPW